VILHDDILIEITVSTGEYIVSHMRSIVTLLVSFAFMGLFFIAESGGPFAAIEVGAIHV